MTDIRPHDSWLRSLLRAALALRVMRFTLPQDREIAQLQPTRYMPSYQDMKLPSPDDA